MQRGRIGRGRTTAEFLRDRAVVAMRRAPAPSFGAQSTVRNQRRAPACDEGDVDPVFINSALLGPARGESFEAGLKGAFLDNRLNASLAPYRIRQANVATDAGLNEATQQKYYTAGNATSKGIEAEVSGQIAPDWNVSAGATLWQIVGDDGRSARIVIPRKAAHLSTTYRMPALGRKLTVGSSVRWQSATRLEWAGEGTARQNAYASVDFMMRYDVDRHLSITGNLNNAFDNKHFATLECDRALYAAPLNGSVTLTWRD